LSRELTERQQKFLEVLFEEANGDVVQAKLLAGYSGKTSTANVVASMKDEIMDATTLYMSRKHQRQQ
jgi:phage terminase small subunit